MVLYCRVSRTAGHEQQQPGRQGRQGTHESVSTIAVQNRARRRTHKRLSLPLLGCRKQQQQNNNTAQHPLRPHRLLLTLDMSREGDTATTRSLLGDVNCGRPRSSSPSSSCCCCCCCWPSLPLSSLSLPPPPSSSSLLLVARPCPLPLPCASPASLSSPNKAALLDTRPLFQARGQVHAWQGTAM